MSARSADQPPSARQYAELTKRLSLFAEPLRQALNAILNADDDVATAAAAVTAAIYAGRDGSSELAMLEAAAVSHAAAQVRLRELAPDLAGLLAAAR